MKKSQLLLLACLSWLPFFGTASAALELVKDGKPVSEIIVEKEALPQVHFAALELQGHLEKISGARLPIVHEPSQNVTPIYVGESRYTREAGITTDHLAMEGYEIVATDEALFLVGRDAVFPAYPRGFKSADDIQRLTKEWQDYVGENWDLPRNGLYDPRNFSEQLGFSIYDPTGTLFGVYAFLEQLGVRWYMPYGDYGTVIPQLATVSVPVQKTAASPVFSRRYMRWSFPSADLDGFLWFKRQKLGMSEMVWFCHGTPYVTKFTAETNPEYRAEVGGAPGRSKRNVGVPRLAPPLRDAMIRFGDKFFDRYPEMNTWPAAPADGFAELDDRDAAAGWDRRERGPSGQFSDYVWTFVNEVGKGVALEHPDKTVLGLAYSNARWVPMNINKLNPNVGVVFCQWRSKEFIDPANHAEIVKQRTEWVKKMDSKEFYIWEYFLNHEAKYRLAGVPVIFTKLIQEDTRSLRGISKGEYVECSYGPGQMLNPALNHYPYMVQARLYWNPDLDLAAFLNEYCELFYGPARAEMKEFFIFAEEVWTRNEPRDISEGKGFLKPADIERFEDILGRAKSKAGDTVYGKRIAAIMDECKPMKGIFGSYEAYTAATAQMNAGQPKAAIPLFQQALNLAQDNTSRADALFSLGEAFQATGDNAGAIKTWEVLWKIPHNSLPIPKRKMLPNSRLTAVEIYRSEKNYRMAQQLLEAYDITNVDMLLRLKMVQIAGDIAAEMGDYKKADEKYRQALAEKGIPPSLVAPIEAKLKKLPADSKL